MPNFQAEALDYGGCEACGTALRLFNCIHGPVSGLGLLLYIFCSNSESGETNISGTNKTHRSTRTTRGRLVFDINRKFAAEFTFCCVYTGDPVFLLLSLNVHIMNVDYAKFQKRFDSGTISRELP